MKPDKGPITVWWIRPSKNKDPYKTWFSASFSEGGRRSGFMDYYVHIEPGGKSFLGGTGLCEIISDINMIINSSKGTILSLVIFLYLNEVIGKLILIIFKKLKCSYDFLIFEEWF